MTRILGALLASALSVLVLVCMGFAGAYQYLAPEIPDAASLRDVKSQLPLRVYTRDGKLLAQIGEQRRIPVAFDEIPPVVIDAFLAAEDARFFEHPGVDWQSLVRALVANVSAGGVREGGGTITMQLARNTVLTSEKTLRRKLKEVFLAMRLEREFSKQEILTLYLNRIFLGQRAYGIGAASEVYFDKSVHDLTLAEAALIAGLPRSPSLDNPVASVERAHDRRAYVLRRMLELGKIDQARHDAALDEPISSRTARADHRDRRAVRGRDGPRRDGPPARRGRAHGRLPGLHDPRQSPAAGRECRHLAHDPRIRAPAWLSRPARADRPGAARRCRRAEPGVQAQSAARQPLAGGRHGGGRSQRRADPARSARPSPSTGTACPGRGR